MRKILIIDNSIYVTGAIKSIVAAVGLLGGRYHFEFAMNVEGEAAQYVIDVGYDIHDVKFLEISKNWRILLYPIVLFANSLRLARLTKQHHANIIHINDLYNLTGLLAKIFNRKLAVVYHVRLTPESYIKPFYRSLAWLLRRWADAIIYVSQAAGEMFYDSPQATLIYDSFSEESILPPKEMSQTLLNCKYLYVGNYVRGKGQDLALEAFSKIAKQLPGSTLRFVGKGVSGDIDQEFVYELKARAVYADLDRRVSFEGFVDDIEKTMKDADVVVNLSESESFSMVCLEALTYGMPLIASDCGGPRELVQNDENGLLVGNRNVDQAAAAMLRMATEPGLAARLAAEGPKSVAEKFSVETSARQLSSVYETLVAQ